MESLGLAGLMTAVLGVASAIVLIVNAAEKIVKVVRLSRAPHDAHTERLDNLEKWKRGVDDKLNNDNQRLGCIEEGNRASQRALLALLDHGIDGNNIEQMQHAKETLQNHLINR